MRLLGLRSRSRNDKIILVLAAPEILKQEIKLYSVQLDFLSPASADIRNRMVVFTEDVKVAILFSAGTRLVDKTTAEASNAISLLI
jgi:hypothetical protein